METFQDRLIAEKSQIDRLIGKLAAFKISVNFDTIPPIQQSLLNIQHDAMVTYSRCLEERLKSL